MQVPSEWPLTGRESELDAIARALNHTRAVLLAGAAGVGKTRLARVALQQRARGGNVRWLTASASARQIPLAAFAPILGDPPEDSGGLPVLLARAYADICAAQGLVLGIDDAHLLDDVSATLLHQLALDQRVTLVITVRNGEPAPDAVTALWKDDLVTRIEVKELSGQQTANLLTAALGQPATTDTARRLYQATAGNVLWLRHLVGGELAEGRLVSRDGLWTWIGQPVLTPALADLIDAAIGPLVNGVRPVVELVAFGEPLSLSVLESLTDPTNVDEALGRGLVHLAAQQQVRLAHPLYGEVLRARAGQFQAQRLRGRIATALANSGNATPDDILRQAVLILDSDLPPDAEVLTAAAGYASLRADAALAVRLLRAARDADAGFEARLALGFALHWSSEGTEAEEIFAEAVTLADTDRQRERLCCIRAANLAYGLAKVDDALIMLRPGNASSPSITLLGMEACLTASSTDQLARAERAARVVVAEPTADQAAQAYAWVALTLICGLTGRGHSVTECANLGTAAAALAPETAPMRVIFAFMEALGLCLAGMPSAIHSRVDQLSELSLGTIFGISLPLLDGMAALASGEVGRAVPLLREVRPLLPGEGWKFRVDSLLACALGAAGQADDATAAIRGAKNTRHPGFAFMDVMLEIAIAWTLAAQGAVTAAIAAANAAARQNAEAGRWAVEVLARHTAVCLGDTTQAARLRELAEHVDGPRAALAAEHAEALANTDPAALLTVSSALEAAELLLPAADAAAQAALLHGQRNNVAARAQAAARAEHLADRCGAQTPATLAAKAPFPLSGRQREIATLAARFTNKA
ncbi:MAG TPA: AAA family ATPase, partial [Pseudonocardia sp.]